MCDKCVNIDYPIGDSIWLPCGGPPSRYRTPPLRRGYSDADGDGWARVQELMGIIKHQSAAIATLKERHSPISSDSRKSFEGVE
jgi:hypothetical protein